MDAGSAVFLVSCFVLSAPVVRAGGRGGLAKPRALLLLPAAAQVEGRAGGRDGPGVRSAAAASRHDCKEGRSRFAPRISSR